MKDLSHNIASYIRDLPSYQGVKVDPSIRARLSAMESPYGLGGLQSQWLDVLNSAEINRYPIAHQADFQDRFARAFDLSASLLFGNGSDEIILMLLLLTGNKTLLSPSPSFVMYEHLARIVGGNYIGVPLEEDFSLSTDRFIQAVKQHKPELVFLALPNNPTGNFFAENLVAETLQATEGLVVVDQAYSFFAEPFPLPTGHPNLLVMGTLSKLGMAGLRFGFLAGDAYLIDALHKVRLPYNINALTLTTVKWALDHLDYFRDRAAEIVEQREWLYKEMQSIDGIAVYPSQTNFLLFRCLSRPAMEVWQYLCDHHVMVRSLHAGHPTLDHCLRVSLGLPEENRLFITKLKDALA